MIFVIFAALLQTLLGFIYETFYFYLLPFLPIFVVFYMRIIYATSNAI